MPYWNGWRPQAILRLYGMAFFQRSYWVKKWWPFIYSQNDFDQELIVWLIWLIILTGTRLIQCTIIIQQSIFFPVILTIEVSKTVKQACSTTIEPWFELGCIIFLIFTITNLSFLSLQRGGFGRGRSAP